MLALPLYPSFPYNWLDHLNHLSLRIQPTEGDGSFICRLRSPEPAQNVFKPSRRSSKNTTTQDAMQPSTIRQLGYYDHLVKTNANYSVV